MISNFSGCIIAIPALLIGQQTKNATNKELIVGRTRLYIRICSLIKVAFKNTSFEISLKNNFSFQIAREILYVIENHIENLKFDF